MLRSRLLVAVALGLAPFTALAQNQKLEIVKLADGVYAAVARSARELQGINEVHSTLGIVSAPRMSMHPPKGYTNCTAR